MPEEEPKARPRIIVARMGPIEQRATMPKLPDSLFLLWPIDESPTPRVRIKGTVIGPVVTPPESNATERKSFGTKIAKIKTMA